MKNKHFYNSILLTMKGIGCIRHIKCQLTPNRNILYVGTNITTIKRDTIMTNRIYYCTYK